MAKRIIAYFFLFDLFIAVLISVIWTMQGTEIHTIQIGNEFLSFMRSTSIELNDFKIEIPNIPHIPSIDRLVDVGDFWTIILNLLIEICNAFFNFLNGVVNVLNFFITILNVIIQTLEFIFLILKNVLLMRDNLVAQA